jgi:hypothetical protein
MGSNETRKAFLRAAFRRRAAVVATAALLAFFFLLDFKPTEAPPIIKTATYGACPDKIEVKRRGATIVGKRPVLTGKVCAQAVDAGFCIDEPKKPLRCLPSFIVAGAQKAATGWLRQRLAAHPSLAQGGGKEVHYFDKLHNLNEWRSTYLDNFATPSALITYEKTPDYLPNATALKSIYSLIPSVSLIFMLRDPSSRAYSAYQHHCRKGRFYEGTKFSLEEDVTGRPLAAPCAPEDFEKFLRVDKGVVTNTQTRLVTWGLYATQIKQVRALGFADDKLLVILSETAMKQPSDLLDAVVEWLGLERFDFSSLQTFTDALGRDQLLEPGITGWAKATYMRHNAMMVRRHSPRPLLTSTRAALDAFYAAPNADLEALLRDASRVAVYPARGAAAVLPGAWSRSGS